MMRLILHNQSFSNRLTHTVDIVRFPQKTFGPWFHGYSSPPVSGEAAGWQTTRVRVDLQKFLQALMAIHFGHYHVQNDQRYFILIVPIKFQSFPSVTRVSAHQHLRAQAKRACKKASTVLNGGGSHGNPFPRLDGQFILTCLD
jgi:hypothetical protein